MSNKTELMFIPDVLWQIIKDFLFTPPICLLCKTEKPKIRNLGQHLCKCVRKSDGTATFSYACTRHYALNTAMKMTLAQKEMFYKAREIVNHSKVGTKELRTLISTNMTKNDLMRLLCSKRSKDEIGKEVVTLCKIGL